MQFIFTINWLYRFLFIVIMFMVGGIIFRHHPWYGAMCLIASLLALLDTLRWLRLWLIAYFDLGPRRFL